MISANTIVGGRYKVSKLLGGGGMKLVYLAEDLRLASRACALAEMVDSLTSPDQQRQAVSSFQREADMLAGLNHEHIPRIYDRFSDHNRHYLVMEYVDGLTLEQKLKAAGGRLDEASVVDLALQILETLEYLHNLTPPVIYRDLKPSNVMITRDEHLKLIDFGIARLFQPSSNATMIGTQGYAPPEQYRGKVEIRSDLYALGATMHHALSGRDPTSEPPFSFPPLGKLCPDVNPALAALINKALSYDVAGRMASALEFKRALVLLKIERLTGGLVDPADAASAIATPQAPARSQLKLPLPQARAAATPPPSPSAPTIISGATEMTCPGCGKRIPTDWRFCSYCSADLRRVLGPKNVVGNPESETEVLPQGASVPGYRMTRGARRVRSHRRLPIFTIGMFFLAGVFVFRVLPGLALIVAALLGGSPPPPEAGVTPPRFGAEAPEFGAPEGSERPEPEHRSANAVRLRRALDQQGYSTVRFRLSGRSAELWGTVSSEADRLMVQTLVFSVTGAVSLNDHIQVQDAFMEP